MVYLAYPHKTRILAFILRCSNNCNNALIPVKLSGVMYYYAKKASMKKKVLRVNIRALHRTFVKQWELQWGKSQKTNKSSFEQ